MKIEKLFALCLTVKDFNKSLDFYNKTLGFEINSKNEPFADFKLGETSLAIFGRKGATAMLPDKYMNNGGGSVIAFQVADLDNYVQEMKERGVEVVEGPKITEWGQKVAYFLDPDGNIIEISEK